MAEIRLENITKVYRDKKSGQSVKAVDNISFSCKDGELLVLLGPSGCGKTTILRMIAGLEEITSGALYIENIRMDGFSPGDRNIAMAFENYALYPPLTVRENLIFPLKAKHKTESEIEERLQKVTDILEMNDILCRQPGELSGGQQQRVSLGRCIIRDADVYLMDEPLSHLDMDLRLRTRGEIKRIHKLMGRTMIYVTHDQTEAMALADRIVVIDNGIIRQIDTPSEVYEYPSNLFVAGFMGEPPMNFINGTITREKDKLFFIAKDSKIKITLPHDLSLSNNNWTGSEIVAGIRPHHIYTGSSDTFPYYPARVTVYESLGENGVLEVDINGTLLTLVTDPDLPFKSGEAITISIDWNWINLFDYTTGESLADYSSYQY